MTTICNAVERFSQPTAITIVSAATAVADGGEHADAQQQPPGQVRHGQDHPMNTATYGT